MLVVLSCSEKDFHWDAQCEEAFSMLKTYLSSPPVLVSPSEGELLTLYLVVSDFSTSAALVRERDRIQQPVYYYNRCHTPIPDPTRLADPNRVSRRETELGLFFFFKSRTCTCGYGPHFITESTYHIHIQKNYHRSGVHQNLYTYTESHLHIQKLYFYIYKSEH